MSNNISGKLVFVKHYQVDVLVIRTCLIRQPNCVQFADCVVQLIHFD